MPSFFNRVFKSKDSSAQSAKARKHALLDHQAASPQPKRQWDDAWLRKEIEPDEVHELLRGCTQEMKSRALNMPFLLLPFRPTSDPSAARSFIRNYFNSFFDKGIQLGGEALMQELRLTEPMVLCSVMKWCWSRLPGGVVTWEAYELFRVGEQDSNMARDSFATFIPISVDSDARTRIIFDFFDLMAAIAAHGKTNGLGGRKLSRLAGWWAFDHSDGGNGFDGGYKSWSNAADATSHLFFAYLRSLSPDSVRGISGISALPISLQTLVQATEYPPTITPAMQTSTTKVVMIVDAVSPTPFALLRRARHFEYRDDDHVLRSFADFQDPVQALTEECHRVLKCISSTNQSTVSNSKASTSLRDASWSRFEDIGFSGMIDDSDPEDDTDAAALARRRGPPRGLSSTSHSRTIDLGRPTTPSWADFLSSGFVDEPGNRGPAPLLLPPDKILPPIDTSRVRSSQSHRNLADDSMLEPGELASIAKIDLDDSFWWVWITSLAGEEPTQRKAVFGRCALIETNIIGGRWLVMEEKVKGAAPALEEGAYVVEKKSRFAAFTKRGKGLSRRKSTGKKNLIPPSGEPYGSGHSIPMSKTSIGPDQHARIQKAAADLQEKQRRLDLEQQNASRRGRNEDVGSAKTNSVFTLQPVILSEAAPAMKWASKFDKDAIREAYLADSAKSPVSNKLSGRPYGKSSEALTPVRPQATNLSSDRTLPSPPQQGLNLEPISNAVLSTTSLARSDLASPPSDLQKINSVPGALNAQTSESSRKPLPSPKLSFEPFPDVSRDSTETPNYKTNTVEIDHGKEGKPKKRSAPAGFKKLFGKYKQESPATQSPSADEAVVQPASAQPSTISRRFSTLRRKTPPLVAPGPSASPQDAPHENSTFTVEPTANPPVHDDAELLSKPYSAHVNDGPRSVPIVPRAEVYENTSSTPASPHLPAQNTSAQRPTMDQRDARSTPITHRSLNQYDSRPPPSSHPTHPQTVSSPVPSSYRAHAASAMASPTLQPPVDSTTTSQPNIARAGTGEERDAARAFSSFDQGPLEDFPAFVPEDSPIRPSSPDITKAQPTPKAKEPTTTKPVETHENMLPAPAPASAPAPPTTQDRWAKLRKNAERAAAKSQEDDSTPSQPAPDKNFATKPSPIEPALVQSASSQSVKAEDGELNGEETFESRVLRIKARVAELTGKMETKNTAN